VANHGVGQLPVLERQVRLELQGAHTNIHEQLARLLVMAPYEGRLVGLSCKRVQPVQFLRPGSPALPEELFLDGVERSICQLLRYHGVDPCGKAAAFPAILHELLDNIPGEAVVCRGPPAKDLALLLLLGDFLLSVLLVYVIQKDGVPVVAVPAQKPHAAV